MRSEKRRKTGYLGRAKVRALLFVSVIESIQDILLVATDKLIVGNMIGQEAVAGTVLVEPLFHFCSIFEMLVGTGATVLYSRAIGDYDEKRKRKILGMSSCTALLFGIFLCILCFTCRDLIFDAMGADGIVRTYGEEYFYYYRYIFLITPLLVLLTEIVYIDGDEIRTVLAGLSLLFGNGVLSFILTPVMGMMGASLGSAIGKIISLIVVLSHFFSKKYSTKPVFSFDPGDIKEMLIIGGTDSANSAFDFLYVFLLNSFISRVFGEKYLAVLGVSAIIYEMMSIGGGVNDAMKTMLLSYRGDKNPEAMKALLLYGLKITFVMGVGFIMVIWIIAPYLPAAYGIEAGEMREFAAWACRLTAVSSIGYVFSGVFLEYYLDIGKYGIHLFGNFLDSLLVRIILNISLAYFFGAMGIWIGEGICTYVSMAILLVYILFHYGRDKFPFLIRENSSNSINLSFRTVNEEIEKARDTLGRFLKKKKVPDRAQYLGMLFLEDMCVLIQNANPPGKKVNVDAYYTCNYDTMNVVFWSDGEPIDMTNEDMVSKGLAGYLISSLLSGFDESRYQSTAGYNRASFVIPYLALIRKKGELNKNNS